MQLLVDVFSVIGTVASNPWIVPGLIFLAIIYISYLRDIALLSRFDNLVKLLKDSFKVKK